MSKYKIKNYKEEFLKDQEKIGIEATKDWLAFGQTSAEQLKQIYSQENFDPETKFYAFEGDKLVGFLTSVILPEDESGIKMANLEFPLTLADHEECAEPLFEKAVEMLKKKGVKKLQTRVGEPYKGTIEKAKKWDYNYSKELYILIEADIKNLKTIESDIEILEFDASRDLEDMIRIFVDELGATEEYARGNFERIINDKENFPIHMIIRDDNKITGRVLAYRNPNRVNEFNFGNLYFVDDKYFEPLLSIAIKKLKEMEAKKASIFLIEQSIDNKDKYISFGFSEIAKIDYYEKEI
jgi:hypothetical protein